MYVLVLRRAGRFVDVRVIDRELVKIGRLRSANVDLGDDPEVSRMHAVLELSVDEGLMLIDLGSAAGTRVNGDQVAKASVAIGDIVGVGEHELEIVDFGFEDTASALAEATQTAAWACCRQALGAIEGGRWGEVRTIFAAGWRQVRDPEWLGLIEELGLLHPADAPELELDPSRGLQWLDRRGRDALATIHRALLPSYRARGRESKSQELWQARAMELEINLAPEDDAPRQVYADWLLDRGDPRGEFIALQLLRTREPAQAAREAELSRRYGPVWAAEFNDFGVEVEFRRGFPWRVRYDGYWPDELIALVRRSRTLERVEGNLAPEPVSPASLGLPR